jgi:hypothetical protein
MKGQPTLRLVWDRGLTAADTSKSLIDKPVISDRRRRFLPDGVESPLTHSQTVGWVTPTCSAKPVCVVSVSSSQRLSRSMEPNIGQTDKKAIGRTYIPIGQASRMGRPRKTQEESFMTRALEVAAITFGEDEATVSNIAAWAGVSQPSASGWKFGAKIENAVKLAVKINACVEYLYTGRGPMFASAPPNEDLKRLLGYWPQLSAQAQSELAGIAYARATPEPETKPQAKPRKAAI